MSQFLNEFGNSCTTNQLEIMQQSLQDPEWHKSLVGNVNKLFTTSKTRHAGLEFLKELLLYFPNDIVTENVLQWTEHCMVQHSEDPEKGTKLNVLAHIVESTKKIEVFDKKFCVDHLSSVLKACLTCRTRDEQVAGLKCLTNCMKRYPSWFGNHRQKIEAYLVECLENSSAVVIEAAAVAFVYFLGTGAAGKGGINYENNFSRNFIKLCATIQNLFNELFNDFPELNNSATIISEIFQFSHANKIQDLTANRIINCLIFLKSMIAKKFSVTKKISVNHVINIIHRGLSIHICSSKTSDVNNRCIYLKRIQIELLKIVKILLLRYNMRILPYPDIIENSLLKSLRRTITCDCFIYDRTYKKHVYETLNYWLSLKNVITETQLQQKLLPILFKDISLPRKTISLNVAAGTDKKSNLKPDEKIEQKALISDVILENNCICALETLKRLLSIDVEIAHKLLERIRVFILTMLLNIQNENVFAPYTNITCQLKLYEVLVAFITTENIKRFPPTPLLGRVLRGGLCNNNFKIGQISKQGLDVLEKITPTLSSNISESMCFETQDFSDLFEKNEEILPDEDNKSSKKEIHIISNVLITPESQAIVESDVVEEVSVAQNNKRLTEFYENEMNDDEEIREPSYKKAKLKLDDSNDVDVIAENDEVSKEEVPEILEKNGIDEKNDEDVEDMFCSFQDVIQE